MTVVDSNHKIVRSMMARPSKFLTEDEMRKVLLDIYGGTSNGLVEANRLCTEFISKYTGTFTFITGMKVNVERFHKTPESKVKGVLNVMRAEAIAQRDGTTLSTSKFSRAAGGQRPPVLDTQRMLDQTKSGDYELAYEGDWIVIHVEWPGVKSKWHGHAFLSGGVDRMTFNSTPKIKLPKLGYQKPGETLRLTIPNADLLKTVEDWVDHAGVMVVTANPATAIVRTPGPKGRPKKSFTPPPDYDENAAEMMARTPKSPTLVVPKKEDFKPEPAQPSIRDRVRNRYHLDGEAS